MYAFSQCLHPADARGTASYQIMEFEFAIMILLYIAKTQKLIVISQLNGCLLMTVDCTLTILTFCGW